MSLEAEKYILSDLAQLVLSEKIQLGNANLEQALLAFTGQATAYEQGLFDPELQLALNEKHVKHPKGDPNLEEEKKEDKNQASDDEKKESDVSKEAKDAQEVKDAQEDAENAQEKKLEQNQALDKPVEENVNIDDVSVVSLLSPSLGFVFFFDEHLSEAFRIGYGMPILEQSVPRNLGIQNDFLGVIYHIFPVFPIEVPATVGGPCCVNPINIYTYNNYDSTSSWTESQISEINTILNNAFKFTFEYFCDRNEGVIVVSQVAGGVHGYAGDKGGIEQYENFTAETFTIRIPSSEESCCPPLNCENPIESIQVSIDSYFVNIPCIDFFSNSYSSGATIYFIDSNENSWELVNNKKEFELRCVDTCCESEVELNTTGLEDSIREIHAGVELPADLVNGIVADYVKDFENAFDFTFKFNEATNSGSIVFDQFFGITIEGGSSVTDHQSINIIQPQPYDEDCTPLSCDNPIVSINFAFIGSQINFDTFEFDDLSDFSSNPYWDVNFVSSDNHEWTLFADANGYTLACTERAEQPLVFDLNNNGYDISSVKDSSVILNLNGVDKHIAWVGPNDGILTYDYSGEGAIANKNFILTENVQGAQTDLQALQMLAGQQGGILDMSNPIWDKLGMWQDASQDGKMDKGEYHTLSDLKIASINLTGDGNVHYLNGNLIANNVTFNYQDGTVGKAADAILKTEDVVQPNQSIPGLGTGTSAPAVVAANDSVAAPVAAIHVDPAVQSAIEVQQPAAVA